MLWFTFVSSFQPKTVDLTKKRFYEVFNAAESFLLTTMSRDVVFFFFKPFLTFISTGGPIET